MIHFSEGNDLLVGGSGFDITRRTRRRYFIDLDGGTLWGDGNLNGSWKSI